MESTPAFGKSQDQYRLVDLPKHLSHWNRYGCNLIVFTLCLFCLKSSSLACIFNEFELQISLLLLHSSARTLFKSYADPTINRFVFAHDEARKTP
jgi:hypothetical protein